MKNSLQEGLPVPGQNPSYALKAVEQERQAAQLMVECREMPEFAKDNLESFRRAFLSAAPCNLKQAWLAAPESDFREGQVRIGWQKNSLLVFAELTDADIFSASIDANYPSWEAGDVFEIFLRPYGQSEYVEFHVTPDNRRLQLRFDDPKMVDQVRKDRSVQSVMIPGDYFQSRTWVFPESQKWFVYAEIPASSVAFNVYVLKGSRWHFSFCRYDYRRGGKSPVISSTSPHIVPDFHRLHEWGLMSFQG